MMHGVVAPAVAATAYLVEQMRRAAHIVADKEERALYSMGVEQVEHPRGHFRHRAVVESQVDHAATLVLDSPEGFRKEKAICQWRLFDEH